MILPTDALHLTSRWFVRPGCEAAVERPLQELVDAVLKSEPDTLVYMVHRPVADSRELQSLPPAEPRTLIFFEVYRDAAAFQRHVSGPVFTRFLEQYATLFVSANGKPFTLVEFLQLHQGFIRGTSA